MKAFAVLMVAATLAGCAASGVKVTEGQLQALQPGVTTEAEAVGRLGQPTVRTRMGDGSVMAIYSYAEVKVRGATFIPIVGAFAGGSDMRTTTVTLRFDAAGKLIDTTSSAGVYGTGMGAAAGAVSSEPTQQPRQ